MTTRERWAARLMMLIGAGALVVSLVLAVGTVRFLQVAQPATATIARDAGPDSSPIWAEAHPSITFTAADGRSRRVQRHEGGRARVGSSFPILYDPKDPEHTIRRHNFLGVWAGALGALWLGAGFAILPLVGRRFGLRVDFNF